MNGLDDFLTGFARGFDAAALRAAEKEAAGTHEITGSNGAVCSYRTPEATLRGRDAELFAELAAIIREAAR
jgi:hypothetical protein